MQTDKLIVRDVAAISADQDVYAARLMRERHVGFLVVHRQAQWR